MKISLHGIPISRKLQKDYSLMRELRWGLMLNTTFNNISAISWQSILLVDETEVPGENHRSVASH